MDLPEAPTRTPKGRLERFADHSVWWIPALAPVPAGLLLPHAAFLTRILVGIAFAALFAAIFFSRVRKQRSKRLQCDIDEQGIIECLIRYPKARAGSLGTLWEGGWAELQPRSITFWPTNVMEELGAKVPGGAPSAFVVESAPEPGELQPAQRRHIRRDHYVVSMQTSSGIVELAADQMSLQALQRLIDVAGDSDA